MASTSRNPELEITNAFEGIAPSASTSGRSTMPERKLPYDVFINHRGPDVKDTLAATLYKTLTDMGLRVFLDKNELQLGDFLPIEIEEAMRSASLHVAIFSQNYAESPWCLAELSFMIKTGTKIVPVFYHVETDVVRYAKEVYAKAFSRHEEKGRYTLEKLQEWKDALNNVSYNVGVITHNEDEEESLLKKIVGCVLKDIKNVPFVVANHPIGLDEILIDFERTTLQSANSHDNVQVVGIWGMGGSGKTTFAKHLYNKKYKMMGRSSFLLDVRDAASKGLLHNKQKKLLEDLGLRGVSIENIEEGKGILASRLRSLQLLIILDNVDNSDQLDALVPQKDNLGCNSLIVVTTRELEVLRCWGISSIYKMKPLNPSHAKQLFCWHAFLQPSPLQEFEDLVERFLHVCNGLPFSLKIFGAQLYDISNKENWKSLLHKISRVLNKDIKDRLKISYDVLDDEEKQIFLDTACFFIGEKKSSAIAVWDGSGWSGLHSWGKLLNKCLVELDDDDRIKMHDHLRDLGREIANNQSPFRLWSPQLIDQFINIENVDQKIAIRGIMATTDESIKKIEQFARCSCSLARAFPELKILHVRGKFNYEVLGDLSRNLVWLRLSDIEQRNLQSLSLLENLRVLDLNESSLEKLQLRELWITDSYAPLQLRELVISGCHNFQRFPKSIGCLRHLKKIVMERMSYITNLPEEFCLLQSLEHLKLRYSMVCSLHSSFGDLRNLEHLDLSWSKNLLSLPNSFGDLRNLGHLDLQGCNNLSSLPSSFVELKNLRYLDLSYCHELRKLPVSFEELTLLQHLDFYHCDSLTLELNILENMIKLEYLDLRCCQQLEELPPHIKNQHSLIDLRLDTGSLREIPVNISQLSKLQKLTIVGRFLTSLPTSLGDLPCLTSLEIRNCHKLECLPDSLWCLNLLENLILSNSGVKSLPKSVGQRINLRKLYIMWCPIDELDLGAGLFTCLKWIELDSTEVSKISISTDCCPDLKSLLFCKNDNLKKIEVLPNSLEYIALKGSPKLNALPSFAQFSSLRVLVLQDCYGIMKMQGLEHCSALEKLIAHTKWQEAGIESLERMERLKKVQLKAISRSGVEDRIQRMQKWPKEEIVVCARAIPDAATRLQSFAFPNLSVLYSFAKRKTNSAPPLEWPSTARCILLCFVVNREFSQISQLRLEIESGRYGSQYLDIHIYPMELEAGKWIWMAILQRSSPSIMGSDRELWVRIYSESQFPDEVEKGVLVTGEENRVIEAFTRLWALLSY
ncbi:hypothetical protein SUGI_0676310 [Cryptomeria japonica]|nr:hypothetical protein SUGI_0676310 [Cryptomeria japonica]